MTNYEKYISEIEVCDEDLDCYLAKIRKYSCDGELTCSTCIKESLMFLFSEYKDPIKLTQDEYIILKNINPKYKWIARDMDFCLCAYDKKPSKYNEDWRVDCEHFNYTSLIVFKHLFQFIKWEDEEPYNIQEILNNCIIEKN